MRIYVYIYEIPSIQNPFISWARVYGHRNWSLALIRLYLNSISSLSKASLVGDSFNDNNYLCTRSIKPMHKISSLKGISLTFHKKL